MANPVIESAYASAAIVAQGLHNLHHPKAPLAEEIKEAIARAVVSPEFVSKEEFGTVWAKRRELANLRGSGDVWDAVARHAANLQNVNF